MADEPNQQNSPPKKPAKPQADGKKFFYDGLFYLDHSFLDSPPIIEPTQMKLPFVDQTMQLKLPIVPDGLLSIEDLYKSIDIKTPAKDIIAAEQIAAQYSRDLTAALTKPQLQIAELVDAYQREADAALKVDRLWTAYADKLQNPDPFGIYISVGSDKTYVMLENWAKESAQLYNRIADELRREREQLQRMCQQFKQAPRISEIDGLVETYRGVATHADKVHKRLKVVEQMTAQPGQISFGWIDETVADLAFDHAEVDEDLTCIGKIQQSELDGATGLILRTHRRLQLLSRELRRIERELGAIFDRLMH